MAQAAPVKSDSITLCFPAQVDVCARVWNNLHDRARSPAAAANPATAQTSRDVEQHHDVIRASCVAAAVVSHPDMYLRMREDAHAHVSAFTHTHTRRILRRMLGIACSDTSCSSTACIQMPLTNSRACMHVRVQPWAAAALAARAPVCGCMCVCARAVHPLDTAGCAHILTVLRRDMALNTANAYISTLGGGHFLCRHVGEAVALARAQARIASLLGDDRLLRRCAVHLVYCAVQMGAFRSAMRMLRKIHRIARRTHDDVLENMAAAGMRYTSSTATLWRAGKLKVHRSSKMTGRAPVLEARPSEAAFDEYYRQHIVADINGGELPWEELEDA